MTETYTSAEFGIEAVITDHLSAYRLVLRDTDANQTISVYYGYLEPLRKRALNFIYSVPSKAAANA